MKRPKKPSNSAPALSKAEFNELKEFWYQKLKDSGFNDIEYNDTLLINGPSGNLYRNKQFKNGTWQAKATYYSMAESFLNEYAFSTELDKVIWEYHANGISVREISETLEKANIKKTSKSSVWLVVNRLSKIMKQMYLIDFREEHAQ